MSAYSKRDQCKRGVVRAKKTAMLRRMRKETSLQKWTWGQSFFPGFPHGRAAGKKVNDTGISFGVD